MSDVLINYENETDRNNFNLLNAQIKLIDFGFVTHLGSANER